MAARIRRIRNDDEIRNRIRTSQLINRLNKNAMGELELSAIQQKSIEILLRKTIPDLSATTLAGDANNPLRYETIQRNVIDPAHDKPEHVNGGPKHTNGSGIQTAPDSEPV
jgi:hypothetical protein